MMTIRCPSSASPSGKSGNIEAAVRRVIGGAMGAGDVIDLFAGAGLDAARLDIRRIYPRMRRNWC